VGFSTGTIDLKDPAPGVLHPPIEKLTPKAEQFQLWVLDQGVLVSFGVGWPPVFSSAPESFPASNSVYTLKRNATAIRITVDPSTATSATTRISLIVLDSDELNTPE
jgi:hypothetical protein